MPISTNGAIVTRLAGALYNQQLSAATYSEVLAAFNSPAALNTLANYLITTDFANKTDSQIATTLVTNLGLSSVAGLGNWVAAQLTAAGTSGKGAKIISLLNDFSNIDVADATYGSAVVAFNAKIDSAQALSQTAGNIGGTFASAGTAGTSQTLTTSLDALTGGAGNDVFNALTTTLGTGDTVTGGAGTDTLSLTGSISAATSLSGFTLSSVEAVNVNIADADITAAHVLTLNMANAGSTAVSVAGLSTTTLSDSLTLNNLAAGSTLAMSNATNLHLNANYVAAATAGTTDQVTLTLNSTTATAAADGIVTIGAGFETLNIATTGGASSLGDLVFGGTGIVITGGQNLTIRSSLDGTLVTVNASASTGNVSIITADDTTTPDATVSGVDVADITITGGTGNDTFDLTLNAASNELNVSGGAGNDTVTIGNLLSNPSSTNAGDVLAGGDGADTLVSDVDLLDAAAGLTGITTLTSVTGFETLNINGFAAEANVLNVANVSADIATVGIITAVGGATTVNFGTAATYGVNLGGAAAVHAGQLLTVTHAGTGTTDALTVANTNTSTGTNQIGSAAFDLTTTGFETVTINTGSYTTATSQLINAVNVGTGALVISGSNGLTTTATTGIITAGTISAAGASGALVMNVAAASGLTTLTGGTASDTLRGDAASTINGGEGNDTIFGGTGNDVLNGDAGADSITTDTGTDSVSGGAGNDTLIFGANLSAGDVVSGGDGTDTISVTNASLGTLKALTISEANTFNTNFSSVETLLITDALDQTSFDLGYMATLTSVTLAAGITGNETLNGFDSGESLTASAALAADGSVLTVGVNNSSTGTADSITVNLTASADTDYGDITVANVETLNLVNSEGTASATVRANTIGLSLSQATGGSAQSVVITGTESLTIDTAIAAATINASGMTTAVATDAGLTMGVAFTATTTITGQTITGSPKVDTLRGTTGADTINAGAGADTIHGNRGADTIDGGTGIDTYVNTNLVSASIEGSGTGTSTGIVVNLGTTAVTNATVLANSTQNLSVGLSSVAAGTIAYLYNDTAPTNSSVVKTISNVENINLAGANGINYVIGSADANTIVGGSGVDYINGGAGNDIISGNAANDTIVTGTGTDTVLMTGAIAGLGTDIVTDFTVGTDTFQFTGANIGDANTTLTFTTAAAASAAALSELNLFTTALANDAAVVTAIQTVTSTTPSLFVIFNTASGWAEVWYDANANVDGGETKLISLTGITTAAGIATITGTNFLTLV